MGVSSEYQVVDISNLTTVAEIEAALETQVLVMEGNGFVVTDQIHRGTFIYLLGVLPSFLSQNFETTETLWIPPADITVVGGTWTHILDANGVPVQSRAQADATGTITVPIVIPGAQAAASRGFQLNSVALSYAIVTAAADAIGELGVQTFTTIATGVATDGDPVLGAVATTIDAAHNTGAERLTVGEHNTLATVDTPAYTGLAVQYQADMTFDAAATTDLTVYGALVNYSATR